MALAEIDIPTRASATPVADSTWRPVVGSRPTDDGAVPLYVAGAGLREGADRRVLAAVVRGSSPRADHDLQRFLASIVERRNAIAVCDASGRVECINVACEALTGWSHAEVTGRHVFTLTGNNRDPDHFTRLRQELEAGGEARTTLTAARRDGTPWHVEETVRPFVDTDGVVSHYVFKLQDVTARVTSTARLAHIAHHDALTGLPNRVLFGERLEHAFQHALHRGLGFTLVCLDLDRFKAINDLHGHAAGDAALRALAESLRQSVREQDTVARLGGDEFAVLLTGTSRREDVVVLLETIRDAWRARAARLAVSAGTLSMGAARFPADAADTDDLLHKADAAMYRAKRRGGDRACLFGDTPATRRDRLASSTCRQEKHVKRDRLLYASILAAAATLFAAASLSAEEKKPVPGGSTAAINAQDCQTAGPGDKTKPRQAVKPGAALPGGEIAPGDCKPGPVTKDKTRVQVKADTKAAAKAGEIQYGEADRKK